MSREMDAQLMDRGLTPAVVAPGQRTSMLRTSVPSPARAVRSSDYRDIGAGLPASSFLVLFSIIGYKLYTALSIQDLPLTRPLFLVIVVSTVFAALLSEQRPVPPRARSLFLGVLLILPVFIAVSATQPVFIASYAVGDVVIILLPLLILLTLLREPRLASSTRALWILGAGLLMSAIVATLASDGPRSTPPDLLLVALGWFLAVSPRAGGARLIGIVVLLLVGYLAVESGYRTHLGLGLLAGPLMFFATRSMRATLITGLLLSTVLLALPQVGVSVDLMGELGGTRFGTLVSGSDDVSLNSRLDEVRDVIATAESQWLPGQVIVGSGPGASYVPYESFIVRNVNEYGTVHHVHIGPAMVFFRYGLIGLAAVIAMVGLVAAAIRTARRSVGSEAETRMAQIFGVTGVLYLLHFAFFNSTTEPTMALTIAVVLWLWATSPGRSLRAESEPDASSDWRNRDLSRVDHHPSHTSANWKGIK